jgi:hypothetical protein
MASNLWLPPQNAFSRSLYLAMESVERLLRLLKKTSAHPSAGYFILAFTVLFLITSHWRVPKWVSDSFWRLLETQFLKHRQRIAQNEASNQ